MAEHEIVSLPSLAALAIVRRGVASHGPRRSHSRCWPTRCSPRPIHACAGS